MILVSDACEFSGIDRLPSVPRQGPANIRGSRRLEIGKTSRSPLPETEDHLERAIGLRVRTHRKLRRQRLRDLAKQAGCSESLLSRVENGLVMPSLSTLHRLSKALSVNVAALVEPAHDATCTVYGPQDRPRTSVSGAAEGDGSTAESLAPYAQNRQLEALIVNLPIGGEPCGPFVHEGEEVGLVLEGELELTVDGVSHRVPAQSSFFLHSNRPHSYRAVGGVVCRVIWINTPPSF
jgi:transcriptional regulator with XRE-family HTH domain